MSPVPGARWVPGPTSTPVPVITFWRVLRRQDGQIIPALVMVMVALLVVGMLFFQVGRAAIFSTEAQTAADAAALAGAKNAMQQLTAMEASTGFSDVSLIDAAQVAAAASSTRRRTTADSWTARAST